MYYQYAHPELFDGVPRPDLKAMSGNLVIYGAGFQGLLAACLLDQQGIEVLCFGDQDVKKQGTTYYGLPVYSPEEMKRRYPGAVPIVTPYSLLSAYQYVTEELGYQNAVTPFSLFLEFDPSEFDRQPELPGWYHPDTLSLNIDMFLMKCVNILTDQSLYSIDLSVTEFCNLRCKNCMSLMPCYQHPRHFRFEDVLHDIDVLLQGGRKFHHIFLEGGEVFLWEPLPRLIRSLSERPGIMRIIPITNGTLLPGKELLEALRLPRVEVRISDYGSISRKDELIDLFRREHIRYWLQLQTWTELSAYRKTPWEREELKRVVDGCCKIGSKGGCYCADGKLFRCPEQGNLHKLGIFVSDRKDYIDLREDTDPESLQREISEFLDVKHIGRIPELCRYCTGRGFSGIEVPPAEQLAPGETLQVRFE